MVPSKIGIKQIIQELVCYKQTMLANCKEMLRLEQENRSLSEQVVNRSSSPLEIAFRITKATQWEKETERRVWTRLVDLLHLERYMLCSEYEKLTDQIEANKVPSFEQETVELWIEGLKSLIYQNVELLVKEVFQKVTAGTYRVGTSWNAPKKKRNNNGIDKFFILYSGDIGAYRANTNKPTITDDIEKCVYILAGETLPNPSIRSRMYRDGVSTMSTPWFKIKCCNNGNTHYWITDAKILQQLNRIGGGSSIGGEDIRIKIFE